VGVFPIHGTSPRELMAAADAALYEAKRGGRDQVVVSSVKEFEGAVVSAEGNSPASWR